MEKSGLIKEKQEKISQMKQEAIIDVLQLGEHEYCEEIDCKIFQESKALEWYKKSEYFYNSCK